MKKYLIVPFLLCSISIQTFATDNCFPKKEVIEYLIAKQEIISKKTTEWDSYINQIVYSRVFNGISDSFIIYKFNVSSSHPTSFLLLKDCNSYQIIECYNLLDEWSKIKALLEKMNTFLTIKLIDQIIEVFNTHENPVNTPSLPKGIKWKEKLIYPKQFTYLCS